MCNALPCFATSLLFKDEGGHLRKSAPTCMHHLLNKCTAANGWFLLLYWIFETDSCRVGVMKALRRRILKTFGATGSAPMRSEERKYALDLSSSQIFTKMAPKQSLVPAHCDIY